MNKKQLAERVADYSNLNKTQAEAAINAMIYAIGEALVNGDKVTLSGLGTFDVKNRAARIGRNPATGESIKVEATRVPHFRASNALKAQLNKGEVS